MMRLWYYLSPDEQLLCYVALFCFGVVLVELYQERRSRVMVKPQEQGNIAVMDEPPGDLVVARKDELKRIQEARTLLEGCNQSIWSNDVLYDLERWQREVESKQRRGK